MEIGNIGGGGGGGGKVAVHTSQAQIIINVMAVRHPKQETDCQPKGNIRGAKALYHATCPPSQRWPANTMWRN